MPKVSSYALILPILFAALFAAGAQADNAQAKPAVDLSKTRQLFLGWTQRERFPDTVTLAYSTVYALQALGSPLSKEKAEVVIKFIRACQRDDGGFVSDPKYSPRSNLVYTYYALKSLSLLGALDSIDRKKAAQYVVELVQEDGAINPSPHEKGRATLASTYYGVGVLDVLGRLERLNKEKIAAHVLTHRASDDGFAMTPRGASSPMASAMAVKTLSALGGLSELVRAGAIRYLEGAVEFLGTLGTRYRALATMQSATAIVEALSAMKALDEVDTEKVARFVESLYIPQNGGFGPSPGLGITPPSTYQGVLCLEKLGRLRAGSGR